jgi:hypothetical protein
MSTPFPSAERPSVIPMALVPALLHRSKPAVWRMAARHSWPVVPTPGYLNRQQIALADLERVTGFTFTAAQIEDAERRHELAASQARARRNAALSLGAVFDLGLAPNGVPDAAYKASSHGPTKH